MTATRKGIRETLDFREINDEAIKLIAKLGAADEMTLRRALEDQQESHLKGRWSHGKLVVEIVRRLEFQQSAVTTDAARSMEEILIAHGLWAGAKRST